MLKEKVTSNLRSWKKAIFNLKIEMYQTGRETNGYQLIAETREKKLILGFLRNGAVFTDGKFVYNGYSSQGQDDKENLVSYVRMCHNKPLEQRVEEEEEPAKKE